MIWLVIILRKWCQITDISQSLPHIMAKKTAGVDTVWRNYATHCHPVLYVTLYDFLASRSWSCTLMSEVMAVVALLVSRCSGSSGWMTRFADGRFASSFVIKISSALTRHGEPVIVHARAPTTAVYQQTLLRRHQPLLRSSLCWHEVTSEISRRHRRRPRRHGRLSVRSSRLLSRRRRRRRRRY